MTYGIFGMYKSDWNKFGGFDLQKYTTKWGGEDWDIVDKWVMAQGVIVHVHVHVWTPYIVLVWVGKLIRGQYCCICCRYGMWINSLFLLRTEGIWWVWNVLNTCILTVSLFIAFHILETLIFCSHMKHSRFIIMALIYPLVINGSCH